MKTLFAAIVCVFAWASSAQAYTYNGHRFPGNQVLYYVNLDSCAAAMPWLDRALILSDIQLAAAGWHDQTNANFTFVYAGQTSKSGLLNDGVTTVFCNPDASPDQVMAQTYWWYDGTGYLTNADIEIWTGTYPQYPFLTSDQPCSAGLYLLDVVIHEFGHMLSLAHSSDVNATMYAPTSVCSTKERTLYSDDIQAIEAVYGPRTDPVPAPTPDPTPTPITECVTNGTVYPLGSTLSYTDKSGKVGNWLTQREAEGWVLLSSAKTKGTTSVTVQCGGS